MKLKTPGFAIALCFGCALVANAQDRSLGSIKGKVRVETGSAAGVAVVLRVGDREVSRVLTQKGGDFVINNVKPGVYGLTFRKAGLSVGTIESLEVKAGRTRTVGDRLFLTIDEGSIAFIRGSVFTAEGRAVPGMKVELALILEDGSAKKLDGRITGETGSFVFRVVPEKANYRVTIKPNNGEPVSQDVEVDGAAVYRLALSLPSGK